MIEGLQIAIPRRLKLLKAALLFFLPVSILLCHRLWGGYRYFPFSPLLETNNIPAPYDLIYVFLIVILCLAALLLHRQRLILFILVLLCAWLVVCDLNRLQPWLYIYCAMLMVFVFYDGRVDDSNKFTSYFILLQMIVASVYFHSGLSMLNPHFIQKEFVEIISPIRQFMSERQFQLFVSMGSATPYLLMMIGVSLMISAIRFLAVALAIAIHFLLLIFLFPSLMNYDWPLWVSNLTFIVILLLLFSGKTKQRYFSPTFLLQMPVFYVVLFLFVLAPLLNRTARWPDFLSSNFKSGNITTKDIRFSKNVYESLPEYEKQFAEPWVGAYSLNYQKWCEMELHASCFPHAIAFNSIFHHLATLPGVDVKEIELK